MPSAYNEFVKTHMKTAPGATPADKMRNVAAAWRKQKGTAVRGSGSVASERPDPVEGGSAYGDLQAMAGGAKRRRRVVAAAAGGEMQEPMHGGARRRVRGAGINLTAANEIPDSVMRGQGAMQGGCARCDEAKMSGEGIMDIAKTVLPFLPLIAGFL